MSSTEKSWSMMFVSMRERFPGSAGILACLFSRDDRAGRIPDAPGKENELDGWV
jgi:hypothetical protein